MPATYLKVIARIQFGDGNNAVARSAIITMDYPYNSEGMGNHPSQMRDRFLLKYKGPSLPCATGDWVTRSNDRLTRIAQRDKIPVEEKPRIITIDLRGARVRGDSEDVVDIALRTH